VVDDVSMCGAWPPAPPSLRENQIGF
jgi:hypothetical protein